MNPQPESPPETPSEFSTEFPPEFREKARAILGVEGDARALRGGRTNRIWRVGQGAHNLVFKLYRHTRANPIFPNDADAEFDCLHVFSRANLAPTPVELWESAQGTVLIYTYVAGDAVETCTPDLMRALAKVHTHPLLPDLRRTSAQVSDLLSEGRALIAHATTTRATHLKSIGARLAKKVSDVDATSIGPVVLHGDPTPANAIAAHDGLKFVDWQCPAVGSPLLDLATALSPAMHLAYGRVPPTAQEEKLALTAYAEGGPTNPQTVSGFTALRALLAWRLCCYCEWKVAQGDAIYVQAFEAELSRVETA